jgi:hypothetical protein
MHADTLVKDDLNVVSAQISTQDRDFRIFNQETGKGRVWHSLNPGDDDRLSCGRAASRLLAVPVTWMVGSAANNLARFSANRVSPTMNTRLISILRAYRN